MRPICFLSDFGLSDDFVGSCKGVMATIAPEARVLDLTHDVPGFGIKAGAEILHHAARYMPEDTVYLAVVDPGVGTGRRELALGTRSGAFMVGPDNGLLIPAAKALGGISESVTLTNGDYHIHPVSNTFHGRDIFAPVAAHLAVGLDIRKLGESIDPSDLVSEELPGASKTDNADELAAVIMAIDRYGNARLSVLQEEANFEYGATLDVDAGDGIMGVRYVKTFGAAKAGELILVPDSHWRLSLSVNQGNAGQALSLRVGGPVRITRTQDGRDDDA